MILAVSTNMAEPTSALLPLEFTLGLIAIHAIIDIGIVDRRGRPIIGSRILPMKHEALREENIKADTNV